MTTDNNTSSDQVQGSPSTPEHALASHSPSTPKQALASRSPATLKSVKVPASKSAHKFALAMATAFGLGNLPFCPGTWGSLFPLALFVTAFLLSVPFPFIWTGLAIIIFIFSWFTVYFGDTLQDHYKRKDPKEIVSDEVAGQALALLAACDLLSAAIAFVFFRLFDVSKIWPIYRLEHLRGGYGILADDLAAGSAAAIVVVIVRLLFLA